MPIQWREQLSIGNDMVDDDHRRLIVLLNTYEEAIAKKNVKLLDEAFEGLDQYTREHFEREERLQQAVHYPHSRTHKRQHEDLVRQVHRFHEDVLRRSHVDLDQVSQFLHDWLVDHVINEDMKMKLYLVGGRHDIK